MPSVLAYKILRSSHTMYSCAFMDLRRNSDSFSTSNGWRCGPGSSVGIATGYGLDGQGIESRWEERFSAPGRTGHGAHPGFCTMGTGSFPWVKSGRAVTLTPHPLLVPWSRKSRAISLLPLWAVLPVQSLNPCTRVHFTFLMAGVPYRS